ncbi:MAG: hypothetical protein Q9208_001401 [Pyrenodesmia sp. 3 TL-2023]
MNSTTAPSDASHALPDIETLSLASPQKVVPTTEASLTLADITTTINSMVEDVKQQTDKHFQNVALHATGEWDPEVAKCLEDEYHLVSQMLENVKGLMRTTDAIVSGDDIAGSEGDGLEMEDQEVRTETGSAAMGRPIEEGDTEENEGRRCGQ